MEEVVRKRVVGAVVLVVIGIMLPLLLSRCLHDPAPDGQAMRVYEITPTGEIEPVVSGMGQAAPAADEAPAVTDAVSEEPSASDGSADQALPLVMEDSAPAVEPTPEPEPQPRPESEPAPEPEPTTAAVDAQQTPDTVKSASEDTVAEAPPQAAEPAPPADTMDLERDVAAGSWIVQVASFSKEQNARALAQQLNDAYTVFYTPAQVSGETWYRVRIGPFDSEAAANNAAAELRAQGRDTLVTQVD